MSENLNQQPSINQTMQPNMGAIPPWFYWPWMTNSLQTMMPGNRPGTQAMSQQTISDSSNQPVTQPQEEVSDQNKTPERQSIQCAVIDSPNDITVKEIPMDGRAGMFIMKDLSAILIKKWDSDGKIYTKEYREVVQEPPAVDNGMKDINSRFEAIEQAIAKLAQGMQNLASSASASGGTKKPNNQKKEVVENE